jgi:hypothetical protein
MRWQRKEVGGPGSRDSARASRVSGLTQSSSAAIHRGRETDLRDCEDTIGQFALVQKPPYFGEPAIDRLRPY